MVAQEVAVTDDAILERGVHASPVVARLTPELTTFLAPVLAWRDFYPG